MHKNFKVIESNNINGVGTGLPLWNIIYKIKIKNSWTERSQWVLAATKDDAIELIFNKINEE